MLARLWLVVLCVVALAAAPASPAGAQAGVPEVAAGGAQPVIEADASPYSADVRASEGAGTLAVVVRVLATGDALPVDVVRRAEAALAPATRRPAAWCDVVQCRRWAGTQLLRYATPPPRRG